MMSDICGVVADKNKGTLTWKCRDQNISINLDGIDQAVADVKQNVVVVLTDVSTLPEILLVFSCDGKKLASFSPPDGFQFYYLSEHPELGASVVCVSSNSIDGWHDWHFGLDLKGHSLFRHCPSY
ncbi:hypothetical protein [Hahella sp. CCB-MM4]|uniref:hypothetical protein n=1 Tax=Hahella sp. (strain CCB-MM4) TaxID=1926491 RepID=UPI00113FCE38|nr:hypothetical protein [Hahella sp. CCB-MM4]